MDKKKTLIKSEEKRGKGRPKGSGEKYSKWMLHVAKSLVAEGKKDLDVYKILGISEATGIKYKKLHSEFNKVMTDGALDQVKIAEKKLIDLARGYKFKSEKIVVVSDGAQVGSHVQRVKTVERVEPNLRAIEYILNNRKPRKKYPDDGWGDIKEVNIGNIDGEPFVIEIK